MTLILMNLHNTLVGRWMDNGLVLIVSAIHKFEQIIKRNRGKPRKTLKNCCQVDKIWGEKGAVPIFIPTMIDDYNHWMGGVDLSDQMIAYYHPDFRYYRNWIPMFIQVISIIRNNVYIIQSNYFEKKKICKHKDFTM